MKRALAPAMLAATALGLVAYIVLVDRHVQAPTEVIARKGRLFPTWDNAHTTSIELRSDGGTLELVREGDASLDYAFKDGSGIDPAAVDRLVSLFEYGIPIRTLGDAPKDFGAERVRGAFTARAVRVPFVLGGPSPTPAGSSYLRVGETYFVVNADFAADLARSPDAYRDKTVVPYLSVALTRFAVISPDQSVVIDRIDPKNFKLLNGLRASRPHLDRLWQPLSELRAEAFVADARAWKDTPPALTLVLTPKEGAPATLQVWDRPCKGEASVPLRRSGPGAQAPLDACVPRGALQGLLAVTDDSLRDRQLVSMRFDEVEELELRALDRTVSLARKDAGYIQRGAKNDIVPADVVEAFNRWLMRVLPLEGTLVGTLPNGAVQVGEWTLLRDEGKEREHITLYRSGQDVYAVRDTDRGVLRYPREEGGLLLSGAENATRRWLASGEVEEVQLSCGTPQTFRMTSQGISAEAAFLKAGADIDHGRVLELFDLMRRMKPEVWIDDAAMRILGDVPPPLASRCSAYVVRGGEKRSFALSAYKDAYIARSEQGAAFVVLPEFGAALERIYLERAFLAQGEKVARIEHNGVTLRGAERVASSLVLLKADEVERLGPPLPEEGPFTQTYRVAVERDSGAGERTVAFGALRGTRRLFRYGHIAATFSVDASRIADLVLAPRTPAVSDAGKAP